MNILFLLLVLFFVKKEDNENLLNKIETNRIEYINDEIPKDYSRFYKPFLLTKPDKYKTNLNAFILESSHKDTIYLLEKINIDYLQYKGIIFTKADTLSYSFDLKINGTGKSKKIELLNFQETNLVKNTYVKKIVIDLSKNWQIMKMRAFRITSVADGDFNLCTRVYFNEEYVIETCAFYDYDTNSDFLNLKEKFDGNSYSSESIHKDSIHNR